jgi:hypothetical protein
MIETLFTATFGVLRESSILYSKDPVVGDDASPSITITTPVYLLLKLSGFTTGAGTVSLTGTDSNDQANSESVTFPGNGRMLAVNKYKTITRVQTAGLTNEVTVGAMSIEASSQTGELKPSWVAKKDIPGRLIRPTGYKEVGAMGVEELKRAMIATRPNVDVREGDKITKGSNSWEVLETREVYLRQDQVHHWKLVLKKLDSPAG